MLVSIEELKTNYYVNIQLSVLSLKEDNMTINNTIVIQDNVLEFDSVLENTALTVLDDPIQTIMV